MRYRDFKLRIFYCGTNAIAEKLADTDILVKTKAVEKFLLEVFGKAAGHDGNQTADRRVACLVRRALRRRTTSSRMR